MGLSLRLLVRGFAFSAILLRGMNSDVGAAEINAKNVQKVSLRVPFTLLEPWRIKDAQGYSGAEIDMLNEVARRLDCSLEFVEMPLLRCLQEMEKGESDIMVGLLKDSDRAEYMDFVDPLYKTRSNKRFYVLKGYGPGVAAYADLSKWKVGVAPGANYFEPFDSDTKIKKIYCGVGRQNIAMLLNGRIDIAIMTESQGNYLLRESGLSNRIVPAAYYYSQANPVYFCLSKRSRKLDLGKTRTIISDMVTSGEADRIFGEYFRRVGMRPPRYR